MSANEIRPGDTVRVVRGRAEGHKALFEGRTSPEMAEAWSLDVDHGNIFVMTDNDEEYFGAMCVPMTDLERVPVEWSEFVKHARKATAQLVRWYGVKVETATEALRQRMGH